MDGTYNVAIARIAATMILSLGFIWTFHRMNADSTAKVKSPKISIAEKNMLTSVSRLKLHTSGTEVSISMLMG